MNLQPIRSVIHPKCPSVNGWEFQSKFKPHKELAEMGYPVEAWHHPNLDLFVLSAVEVTSESGKPDLGPEYHLSVSKGRQQRCTSAEALWVLGQFDLIDALEDNHVPGGFVRNFWRPVADHLSGYECPCVDHEPAMAEDKGDFVWRGITR